MKTPFKTWEFAMAVGSLVLLAISLVRPNGSEPTIAMFGLLGAVSVWSRCASKGMAE